MMNRTELYNEIFEYVAELTIIDTHEHLPYREEAREKHTDILKEYLAHYFSRDLLSAGLSPDVLEEAVDVSIPLQSRWEMLEPYWELARYTGYGRSLDLALQGLYGLDGFSADSIQAANEKFLPTLEPGHFNRVLKEKCRIEISVLDSLEEEKLDCDRTFFKPVFRTDFMVFPQSWQDIKQVEQYSGITVCSFRSWLEACEAALTHAVSRDIAGFKCALAYLRTLAFDRVIQADAERDFNRFFEVRHMLHDEEQLFFPGKAFQDYMMHFVLGFANKQEAVFQIHTGLQEGSGNIINNSDPALLSPVCVEYPDISFDLFHIGFPFQEKMGVMAKTFPNVYIDMCWAHIISPATSIRALSEWLEYVPYNKINGFGGDYKFVDGVYGHQLLARKNISTALADKVEEGLFSVEKAKEIAKSLLYDNPRGLFGF